MGTVTIKDLESVASVVPLYVAVFNASPWNDGWSATAAEERLSSFAAFPRFHGVVAVEESKPVGLAMGWGERWTTGWHFHLKEMCVAPTARRGGIGSQILRSLEARLATFGFERVYLQTGRTAPARNFYEAAGFRDLDLISLGKRVEV